MSHKQRSAVVGLVTVLVAVTLAPVQTSAQDPGGVSVDEAVEIAIDHVRGDPEELGVTAADVTELHVASAYTSSHNRVTHVNLNQRHRDLEVFGAYATVNVAADGAVLFTGDSLTAGLRVAGPDQADLDAIEAVEAAAAALDLDEPVDLRVLRRRAGPAQETLLSDGGISDEPIPARLGWQPTEDGLRLAWQLVIDDSSDVHLWNATVDAETGVLLDVDDWTDQDTFEGLASALLRPSALQSSGAGALASSSPPVVTPVDPVDDGSSYNVLALPAESPLDGRPRTVVTNPADALASPFGWHDVSGTPEPDFTVTRGNNVHAYTDRDASNQPDPGSDPDGGPGLEFDFPMDLDEHPQAYADAATTNLFYWCNVTHDIMYRYGFDEPSGNFQVNNYGRGGAGGDDVRCEAMDGGGHNNANFSTPAQDGGRPRMQMFLWPGFQFGLPNAVTVDAGMAEGTYPANYARFTPAPTTAGFAGEIVTADPTGIPLLNHGCVPYTVPDGAIALVDNTALCNFRTQVANAEDAGASAVIVAHNSPASPPFMSGSMSPPAGIPAVMVSQSDGNLIRVGLPATGSVHRNMDRPPIHDGDLEAGIVIHEYSHGVSNRLTGGPTVNCLSGQQRMGEGWSDWHAIAMLIDPELDDPEAARGLGVYALFQESRQGAGIRPRPYSRNMAIQPATYDSIRSAGWLNGATLSMPHGVGHVWAAMLWDMTWDLMDKHGFNPNLYEDWSTGGNNLAYQLVNDGLKFQGCAPTFVVGRDAIIAADDALTGGENACTLWASFARRGLGFSADDGGTTNRNDNTEAFDTHPECGSGFDDPIADQPALNTVEAGRSVPLRFSIGGDRGRDILASNSPYSRLVDCATLATVDPESPFVTPRPLPVPAESPGQSGLSYSRGLDRYQFSWKTLEEWAGTCREFVLTLDDGRQHRAYFSFVLDDGEAQTETTEVGI